jgi:hypothetical protein
MSDTDTDFSNDWEMNTFEEEDILDIIAEYEEAFFDDIPDEEMNGKYYIGSYCYCMDTFIEGENTVVSEPRLFFGDSVSPSTFFRFPFEHILKYLDFGNLHYHSYPNENTILSFEITPKVHILQVYTQMVQIRKGFLVNQYLCVLKTVWISLIQRHWKSILRERQQYIAFYKNPIHQRSREIGSSRPKKRKPRGLRGMLSCYAKKK